MYSPYKRVKRPKGIAVVEENNTPIKSTKMSRITDLQPKAGCIQEALFFRSGSQLCFGNTKTLAPHAAGASFGGFFIPLGRDSKNKEDNTMEPMKQSIPQNKGGRPKKAVKKNQIITLKCTSYEKMQIRAKAKKAGLSTSEYLLQLGLNGKIDSTIKTLPKEVLHVTGTLNHMAANLNQLAKKHNSVTDILTPLDRANLQLLSGELKGLAVTMKNYLK